MFLDRLSLIILCLTFSHIITLRLQVLFFLHCSVMCIKLLIINAKILKIYLKETQTLQHEAQELTYSALGMISVTIAFVTRGLIGNALATLAVETRVQITLGS